MNFYFTYLSRETHRLLFFYLSDGLLYGLWIYPSFSLIYLEYGAFIKCALDVSVGARLVVFVHGLFNHEPRVVKTIICHSVRLPQRTFLGSFFECVFLFMLCTASWISTIAKHCWHIPIISLYFRCKVNGICYICFLNFSFLNEFSSFDFLNIHFLI